MAEYNRRLGVLQHGRRCLPRSVGEVHDHSQPVHLLHHSLQNTTEQFIYSRNRRSELTAGDGERNADETAVEPIE